MFTAHQLPHGVYYFNLRAGRFLGPDSLVAPMKTVSLAPFAFSTVEPLRCVMTVYTIRH